MCGARTVGTCARAAAINNSTWISPPEGLRQGGEILGSALGSTGHPKTSPDNIKSKRCEYGDRRRLRYCYF